MKGTEGASVQTKQTIRGLALARRKAQHNSEQISRQIMAQLLQLPEYLAAQTVLFYVDSGSEVKTRCAIEHTLGTSKRLLVPFCNNGYLQLFHLKNLNELQPGTHHILEPSVELRTQSRRIVPIKETDLVLVPGLAFDPRGARIGHGAGYYDKLLAGSRNDTLLVAPAFDCQIFDEVPMAPHDISMDQILTESTVYKQSDRSAPRFR